MRHIERPSEPEILSKKKAEWTQKFIDSGKSRPDSSKYAHQDIKSILFTISHNKCFYCESILKNANSEIDHLIEVAENKALAFEWTNLMLACPHCNDKRPNKDIPVNSVLNPCRDSDEEIDNHIYFDNEQINFLTEKGDKTIQKFKLSSKQLDFLRMKALDKFKDVLIEIKTKMIQESRKTPTQKELELLRKFAKSNHCYSKMFSKLLEKYGI